MSQLRTESTFCGKLSSKKKIDTENNKDNSDRKSGCENNCETNDNKLKTDLLRNISTFNTEYNGRFSDTSLEESWIMDSGASIWVIVFLYISRNTKLKGNCI